VLNCPLKLTPVVLCTTIVTDNAVSDAVLASFKSSSLKNPLLDETTGVSVTPPVPPVAAATVRLTLVVCVRDPLVPVMVIVAAPSVAVLDAVSVSTLLVPVVVVVAGLKLAVTPVGSPLAVNETALAKLLKRVMETVLVPLAPRFTVRLAGLADKEKSGVAAVTTVRATVVV
jgi:hypothetical protein